MRRRWGGGGGEEEEEEEEEGEEEAKEEEKKTKEEEETREEEEKKEKKRRKKKKKDQFLILCPNALMHPICVSCFNCRAKNCNNKNVFIRGCKDLFLELRLDTITRALIAVHTAFRGN